MAQFLHIFVSNHLSTETASALNVKLDFLSIKVDVITYCNSAWNKLAQLYVKVQTTNCCLNITTCLTT